MPIEKRKRIKKKEEEQEQDSRHRLIPKEVDGAIDTSEKPHEPNKKKRKNEQVEQPKESTLQDRLQQEKEHWEEQQNQVKLRIGDKIRPTLSGADVDVNTAEVDDGEDRRIQHEIVVKIPKRKEKKDNDWETKLHAHIPNPPFSVMVVGPRKTGKSALAHYLLSKDVGMYGAYYHASNIIFYSPTARIDKTFHDLKLEHVIGPNHQIGDVLNELIVQQEELMKQNNARRILFCLDDVTQIAEAWKVLERLGYTGRHYKIDTMAIAHKMSSIPRGVRTQIQQWLLFRPHEQSEWEWVMTMFSRKRTMAIWEKALKRVWDIEYNFIYIDFERKGLQNVYRERFNKALFTPSEIAFMNGDIEEDPTMLMDHRVHRHII